MFNFFKKAKQKQFNPDDFITDVYFWDKHSKEIEKLLEEMKESNDLKNNSGRVSCLIKNETKNVNDSTAQLVYAKAPHNTKAKFHPIGYVPKHAKAEFNKCKPFVKSGERYWRLYVRYNLSNGVSFELTCPKSIFGEQ